MFCLAIFCCLIGAEELTLLRSTRLEMVAPLDGPWLLGTVDTDKNILASNGKTLFHWDFEGKAIRQIGKNGYRLGAFHFQEPFYWLSARSETEKSWLYFKDDRLVGQETGPYLPYLNICDKVAYAPFKFDEATTENEAAYFYKNNYLFMAREVIFQIKNGRLTPRPTSIEFCKLNDRHLSMELNFKQIWILKKNTDLIVVNQLQPRAYFYSPATMSRERMAGEQVPTTIPYKSLVLPHYNPPPQNFWSPPRTMLVNQAVSAYQNWWQSLNLITYFGHLKDGYVLAFKSPIFDSGKFVGHHTMLQAYDKNLHPIGRLLKARGLVLASRFNQVFLLDEAKNQTELKVYHLKE